MKTNIIFLDGVEPPSSSYSCFIGYLFPLVSVLEEANFSSKILSVKNLSDYSLQGILCELKKYQFDAVGMTTNADNIRFVYKICDAIKSVFPQTTIILGGPHVTYADEKTLKESNCDIIIRDEGEMKLLEILHCLNCGDSYTHVKGITYKKNGVIFRNENPAPLDINKLPTPQYAILSNTKYWIIPTGVNEKQFSEVLSEIRKSYNFFMTGRGCPYKCAFCVEGNIKRKYQFRSVDNVRKDLTYFLQETRHTFVAIADDTFTSSPKRVEELCSVFKEIQQEHPFVWFCEGRVDVISKHLNIINTMYNAGLKKLQIGIESGSQDVLDIYNKGITLKQLEIVVQESAKFEDLIVAGNLILGNPHETLPEFIKSLEFIKHLLLLSKFKLDITTSYLTPFHGTPVRIGSEKYGIEVIPEFEFNRIGMLDIVSKPVVLSTKEVNSLKMLTEMELGKFINENIFKLPKDFILSFYTNKSSLSQMPIALYRSWWKLASFRKYLKIWNKTLVVNNDAVTLESSYKYSPIKLWDIEFDSEQETYYFIDLMGQENVIKDDYAYLWKYATGKYSIYEIFKNRLPSSTLTICDVFEFYKKLESKWALVFIEF